jgi:hypothetical protein
MTRKELMKIIDELGEETLKDFKELDGIVPRLTGNMQDNAIQRIPNETGGWDIIIDTNVADYAKYTMMQETNPRNFQ